MGLGFTTLTGTTFIQADNNFAIGDLWSFAGGALTGIATGVLSTALPTDYTIGRGNCAGALTNTLGAVFQMNIPNAPTSPDSFGGFSINTAQSRGLTGGALFVTLQSSTGPITVHSAPLQANMAAAQDLTVGSAANQLHFNTNGDVEIWGATTGESFRDVFVTEPLTTQGSITIVANRNLILNGAANISSLASPVTLVADNAFPVRPFLGPGFFSMTVGTEVNAAGSLRIFTSQQNLNSILGTLNGFSFSAGEIFQDSNLEQWCTYLPSAAGGFPFTIFYKDCLQRLAEQAILIADEMLFNLHPYNEFPGWLAEFSLEYDPSFKKRFTNSLDYLAKETFQLRRRHLNYINHPKSYTLLKY
jgi:hypothetical protein